MPRINIEDSKDYSNGGGYFSLKDDGDVEQVRILLDSEEDIEIYAIHNIETKNGLVSVNCLREPGAAIDTCPFCQNRFKVQVSIYLKLLHNDAIKIWNRGKSFYESLKGLLRRYKPLPAYDFEIERHGKAGDKQTSYQFYQVNDIDSSVKTVDDLLNQTGLALDEKTNILGNYIKEWSYDEMWDYIEKGIIPGEANSEGSGNRNYNRQINSNKQSVIGRRASQDEIPNPPQRAEGRRGKQPSRRVAAAQEPIAAQEAIDEEEGY